MACEMCCRAVFDMRTANQFPPQINFLYEYSTPLYDCAENDGDRADAWHLLSTCDWRVEDDLAPSHLYIITSSTPKIFKHNFHNNCPVDRETPGT